jgi:hypothetical protein
MNLLAFTLLAFIGAPEKLDEGLVVVRAPATISQKEQKRLISLATVDVPKGTTFETTSGDLIVKLGPRQTLVVSKESVLMEPIRLAREIFLLGKKYGTGKLIPFSELSPLALNHFRRDLIVQFPRYDVNSKSCFTIQALIERKVRAGNIQIVEGSAPQSSLSPEELKKKRQEFYAMSDSAPLVILRSEEEAKEFESKWSWMREGSFYDPWEDQRLSIELERRGLEFFQGWFQFEMERIDSEMTSYFASDKSWEPLLRGRSAKTVEELKGISPRDYESVRNHLTGDYDIYGFSSPEKALEAYSTATVSFRFRLKLSSSIEGSKNRFTFSPVN